MKFIEYNGLELYIPSSVSLAKGKKAYDYSANWSCSRQGANLKGNEYKFLKDTTEFNEIRDLIGKKYGLIAKPPVNQNMKLIDKERALDYLNTPTVACKVSKEPYGKGGLLLETKLTEPLIESTLLAEKLNIQHKNLINSIRKYKEDIEFNPITLLDEKLAFQTRVNLRGPDEVVALLNFRQALFVGTLSRNSKKVIEFKSWLTAWFDQFVKDSPNQLSNLEYSWIPTTREKQLQAALIQLASYSPTPMRQEVHVADTAFRVDLLWGNKVAIELKTIMITPCLIKKLVFELQYYFHLKRSIPEFETLILSSSVGITDEAREALKFSKPHIIYESIPELTSRIMREVSSDKVKKQFRYLKDFNQLALAA